MENISYPSNYFDPFEATQAAQCTQCGEWFTDPGEIEEVKEVYELDGSVLFQGVCVFCEE